MYVDAADQLLTLAEISVALAGFAGIIASFQLRAEENITHGTLLALSTIVYLSLGAAFFAGFPLLLINFGLPDEVVWTWSSLLAGVNQIVVTAVFWKRANFSNLTAGAKLVYYLIFIVAPLTGIANLMNAAGIVFNKEFGPFFAMYILNLGIVCVNFARLMLTPLWKVLRDREKHRMANSGLDGGNQSIDKTE